MNVIYYVATHFYKVSVNILEEVWWVHSAVSLLTNCITDVINYMMYLKDRSCSIGRSRVQILSFRHTKFSKCNHLGSPCPPVRGPRPLRKILDPPLCSIRGQDILFDFSKKSDKFEQTQENSIQILNFIYITFFFIIRIIIVEWLKMCW